MNASELKSIKLRLASADDIRAASGGEVTVDAAFDDSGAPVTGGLFCRTIFGSDGRGFGHIELAHPIAHPWFGHSFPPSSGEGPGERSELIEALAIVPPTMRPFVASPSGAALSSDLNELYPRVIARNNAVKDLLSGDRVPGRYLEDAKERLASAVTALIEGSADSALKSLTDLLVEPSGYLKRNLSGARQDYSGRSVISPGPELNLRQCGLPYEMALEQLKPFIARRLVENGVAANAHEALEAVALKPRSKEVRLATEQVASEKLVLLNRAPTLHRLSIQPFEPVIVDHRSIVLHPLACLGFNADFDGDQMAVHVPISKSAQDEARALLDSAITIASPANGKPVAGPVQDIVTGLYFLTAQHEPVPSPLGGRARERGGRFDDQQRSVDEIISDLQSRDLHPHHALVLHNAEYAEDEVKTTAGRVLFNATLPPELRFVNKQTDRHALSELIARCLELHGHARTREVLDELNRLGLEYATRYAPSYGLGTAPDLGAVSAIREDAADRERSLSFEDRWALWSDASSKARDQVMLGLDKANPLHTLIASGARGSATHMNLSFGIAGPIWREPSESNPRPVFEAAAASNYWQGMTPLELFGLSFSARKGLIDTHVRSMSAFDLMKRLIHACQGIRVTCNDCGTSDSLQATALIHDGQVMQTLAQRITGRVSAEDVRDRSGNAILRAGEPITKQQAEAAEAAGLESVKIRSVLTCAEGRGVCAKCYGEDMASGEMVKPGAAVGVIAAHAMAEPGIQLTRRTYYGSPQPPKDDKPAHPGGLQQLTELFDGKHPELSPTEFIAAAQRILTYQGVQVNDKHFELIARRMYSFAKVEDPGESGLIAGEIVANEALSEGASGTPVVLGISEAAEHSTSFIGSAAVGDARRILAAAAARQSTDPLESTLERIALGLAPKR